MKETTPASVSASRWALALAATAGLGVGVGASFAASRGGASREAVASVTRPASAPREAKAERPGSAAVAAVKAAGATAEPAPREADAAGATGPESDAEVPKAAVEVTAPTVDAGAVEALVARLGAAHARLHAPAEAAAIEQALERALDEVFAKRKAERRFAKEFYAAFGAGRFARGGALTALGEAVVQRARDVRAHGLDPEPYDLPGLEAAIAGLGKAAAEAPRPQLSALAGLLEAPVWDAGEARERLSSLGVLPPESAIEEAVGALAAGRAVTSADAAADARLYRAFYELVTDFRFVHRAGPFTLTSRETVLDREKKALKDFMAQLLAEDAEGALARLDPPHPQYRKMVAVLADYRRMAAAEPGCPKLSAGWRFRKGAKGEEVKKLQERLACEGYYQGELDGHFEGDTIEAVRSYQRHHYLPDEGTVLEETMKSLNVPLARRAEQIELALQRMREAPLDRMTADFFLRVNIPAFELTAYERGEVVRRQRVIVGTNRLDDDKVNLVQGHINRTKLFGTRLYEIIVNPTWILPKRVEEGELKSSLEKDESYLEKSNIKKIKLGSGTEVFVQGAGKGNVLGKVKFLLEGTNAIYLHDTDKRHLFKKQRRDFSHGCMRVHEAIDFGKWLLARDGFSQAEIDRAFGLESLQTGFDLKQPVDFVTEYITVDLSDEGKPVFHEDIYGYDAAYFQGELPPREKVRWGSQILRPRWVPVMDGETVEGWRKAGKAAPRNLGPDGKPKKDDKGGGADIDEGP